MYWPDAFPASDHMLQRAAGLSSPRTLRALAERWRPWRAYAALHLRLAYEEDSLAASPAARRRATARRGRFNAARLVSD
jgi:AraC family transcriptional regulator of adaptative response / DNA-3-methyladenine glycosylase II